MGATLAPQIVARVCKFLRHLLHVVARHSLVTAQVLTLVAGEIPQLWIPGDRENADLSRATLRTRSGGCSTANRPSLHEESFMLRGRKAALENYVRQITRQRGKAAVLGFPDRSAFWGFRNRTARRDS
jgi:hypothetical protein